MNYAIILSGESGRCRWGFSEAVSGSGKETSSAVYAGAVQKSSAVEKIIHHGDRCLEEDPRMDGRRDYEISRAPADAGDTQQNRIHNGAYRLHGGFPYRRTTV